MENPFPKVGAGLALLIVACGPPLPPEPVPHGGGAEKPPPSAAQPADEAAKPAPPDQAQPPKGEQSQDGSPGHGPHAQGHGSGEHAHGHGSAGYQMDFSEVKRFAAHFDDPARDTWQKPDEVVSLLSVAPGSTVVDLGVGTGYFLGRLSKAVGESGKVLALDAEPQMVAYSEHRAHETGWKNVVARQIPFESPELAPESVDRVLIVDTWHHISDREAYAAKLRAGLRSGGAVVIVDFTLESDLGPPASHRLAPERVVQELEAGGLAARIVEESLPKQYVVRGDRR